MHGQRIKHKLVLVHFNIIMVNNTHLMNLKIIFPNMELQIKLQLLIILNKMVQRKRMNRTSMNMASSMMFFRSVKLMFWGDVVVCASYLRSISPSHAIKDKTPHEMWFGHLPYVRHLRVFGSTCYALIPKEKRNKFGARSRRCIFLGIQTPLRIIVFMMR